MVGAATLLEKYGPLGLINLKYRTDRREEFSEQLRNIGLSYRHTGVRIFPAVRPTHAAGFSSIGAHGCFMSHLGVLQEALEAGSDGVIVCEDDCDFAPDFLQRLPGILDVLASNDWDIFYGGATSFVTESVLDAGTNIFRLPSDHQLQCCHFYIVRARAISAFVPYLKAILGRPPGHPEGGPMHYDGALNYFRSYRPDIVTVATMPPLASQRPSRTDIHALAWYDRTLFFRDAANWWRRIRR